MDAFWVPWRPLQRAPRAPFASALRALQQVGGDARIVEAPDGAGEVPATKGVGGFWRNDDGRSSRRPAGLRGMPHLLPYPTALAAEGPAVLDRHPALARGLNVRAGRVVHDGVAATFPALAGAA